MKASEMVVGQWYERDNGDDLYRVICLLNATELGIRVIKVWSPHNNTCLLSSREEVTHLPDCTGWDWKPEPTYSELLAKCGLKVGDRVKVTGKTNPEGWNTRWNANMDLLIGQTGIIEEATKRGSFYLLNWYFPCTSLQKVEAEYRPFKDAEEFKPHRDRWLRRVSTSDRELKLSGAWRHFGYEDDGIWINSTRRISWTMLLEDSYKFDDDGSPCGVLVE
jgi:hypothetical protein